MTRDELVAGIAARYNIAPDYPWSQLPDACVFRHADNRKWFCLYMSVPAHVLGLEREREALVPIINVKARPEMVGSLRSMSGILPAYHMNKEHWVSVLLEEADAELIWGVLADSFQLTQ